MVISGRTGSGVVVPDLTFTSSKPQPHSPGSFSGAAQGSCELLELASAEHRWGNRILASGGDLRPAGLARKLRKG